MGIPTGPHGSPRLVIQNKWHDNNLHVWLGGTRGIIDILVTAGYKAGENGIYEEYIMIRMSSTVTDGKPTHIAPDSHEGSWVIRKRPQGKSKKHRIALTYSYGGRCRPADSYAPLRLDATIQEAQDCPDLLLWVPMSSGG